MAGPTARATTGVDNASQCLEQGGHAVYFVENDQFVHMPVEKKHRIGQLLTIRRRLQVEINRGPASSDFQRQGGLADLTRADDRHRRLAGECRFYKALSMARYHRYRLKTIVLFCNVGLHS